MKKLITAAAIAAVCAALPASATAENPPEYWGGEMGDNLPGANITFKVRDGRVRHLRSMIRVRCHRRGGGPAADSRLAADFSLIDIVDGGFRESRDQLFKGGRYRVAGRFFAGDQAAGFFKGRYITEMTVGEGEKACHTGKQDWNAEPIKFREWKKLREIN